MVLGHALAAPAVARADDAEPAAAPPEQPAQPAPAEPVAAPTKPPAAQPSPTANPLAEPIDDPRWGRLGTVGAIIGGTGLATLTVSLGLALKASSDLDDAVTNPAFECKREVCNAAGNEAVEDAHYLGDVATATALIGATLTAVGATMVIVELAAPVVKQQSIAVGIGPGMLFVSGSFR